MQCVWRGGPTYLTVLLGQPKLSQAKSLITRKQDAGPDRIALSIIESKLGLVILSDYWATPLR